MGAHVTNVEPYMDFVNRSHYLNINVHADIILLVNTVINVQRDILVTLFVDVSHYYKKTVAFFCYFCKLSFFFVHLYYSTLGTHKMIFVEF